MAVEIVSRWDETRVLYRSEGAQDVREAVVEAASAGADLREADLRWADLSKAYLDGADLSGAILSGAYLREADLYEADLGGANLRKAYLNGANLRGANLSGANLRGANLDGANLRGANLDGANLDADVCPRCGEPHPTLRDTFHTAHFYGGPWDGEVKDLRPFVPTVLVPLEGTMGVYRHAYAMGSSNPAGCRDHVFRYAGERER